MDNLISITLCEDGSCCCLPPRTTMVLISSMSLLASAIDELSVEASGACCLLRDGVESMRWVLLTLFQLANILLLLASVIENAILVNIYVCYTLGFVVMGLVVSILELLCHVKHDCAVSVVTFVSEVGFIFVISRCLPLVNTYRSHLEQLSATLSEQAENI